MMVFSEVPRPQANGSPLQRASSVHFRAARDVRWDHLDETQARLVRQALVRAAELRQENADAGDAYLEGFLTSLLN